VPRPLLAAVLGVPAVLLVREVSSRPGLADPAPLAGPAVQVTPKGTATTATAHATGYVATFIVKNVGTVNSTYTLSCNASGQLSCVSVSPAQVTLSPNQQIDADVTYGTGDQSLPAGNLLRLAATGGGVDTGYYKVTVNGSIVALAATGAMTSTVLTVRRRQPLLIARFTLPVGLTTDTAATVLRWRSAGVADTVTYLSRHNRGLLEWEVDSTHWLTPGGASDSLVVRHCTTTQICTTERRRVLLVNDSTPLLGFTGMPLESWGSAFTSGFGPGLIVSGGEIESGISTPAYVSLGASRAAGLVYSTRTSYPRALVHLDLELTWPASVPSTIKLYLKDGGTILDSLIKTTPTCFTAPVRRCRATLMADFAGTTQPTQRKWLQVEAQVTSSGVTKTGTDSVEVVIVDRRATPYGTGWWPAGILQLVAAGTDRLLIAPNGSAAIFRGNGDSVYVPPLGSFTTLTRTAAGWELAPRGSTARMVFNASGRLVVSRDRNGNRDSVVYAGATDTVTTIVDPLGKTMTFTYTSGRLSQIRTLTGGGARDLFVRLDPTTNRLTYARFPYTVAADTALRDTVFFRYLTYPGPQTAVLNRFIGLLRDTTTVLYDSAFRRRPAGVQLPRVPNDALSMVLPVIDYTAYERQGVGAYRSMDSLYVQMEDPRGNWTKSTLNRWGQALRTWDAVGTLSQSAYTPEGFLQWTQPATVDSDRVHLVYDSQRRPVKSYTLRRDGTQLRTDSLIYDQLDRVVKTVDPRGQVDSLTYDANGNVIAQRDAAGNTVRFWYKGDGRVDSMLLPGAPRARRFTYEGTWGNLATVIVEDNSTVAQLFYDAYGRTIENRSKVRVKETGTSFTWQWRRTRSFLRTANTADSVLLERTANCADPCSTPPAWPADTAWSQRQRTWIIPDRAGRDSVRMNAYGDSTVRYFYDKLGRLLVRRAMISKLATADDSLRYDVAGNLRRTRTRRGDTISTRYDSRNRDTLSVIQGVGHLHTRYSGALGLLDSMWLTSAVDSIGGVNGTVRWAYDTRGRLIRETSTTGAQLRNTLFTYDFDERDSTYRDTLGLTTAQYEIARNIPNVLMSPLGDTLTYTYDGLGRPQQLQITSGTSTMDRFAIWNPVGELTTLINQVNVGSSYIAGRYSRVASVDEGTGPDLGPRWNGYTGAGVGLDSLVDSLTYDGWERLIEWRQRHKVPPDSLGTLTVETYGFDREGNIFSGGGEVYDSTTNRLQARVEGGDTLTYGYDAAGNLTSIDGPKVGDDWTYTYDALNRLVAVRNSGTLIARYGYDVLGRRIAKRVYSGITGGDTAYTRFVYRGDQVAYETDSLGTVGMRYTWGYGIDDLASFRDTAGKQYTTVQDPLHSVRGLVDSAGTWKMSQRFTPYGELQARDSAGAIPKLRYQWTGREYDAETGNYFHRSRYYDSGAKRFIQEDQIGYAGGNNLYQYVGGLPLASRDPFGEILCRWVDQVVGYRIDPGPPGAGFDWITRLIERSLVCADDLPTGGTSGSTRNRDPRPDSRRPTPGTEEVQAVADTGCKTLNQPGVIEIGRILDRRSLQSQTEEMAFIFLRPSGRLFGQLVLDPYSKSATHVRARTPQSNSFGTIWGSAHTHLIPGRDGLASDLFTSISESDPLAKIVFTPDSMYLIPGNPTLYQGITEACARK
jgi:RHS repeat-associated protein